MWLREGTLSWQERIVRKLGGKSVHLVYKKHECHCGGSRMGRVAGNEPSKMGRQVGRSCVVL